jgi:hypothetical protein
MSSKKNLLFTKLYEGQGLGNQLWVYAAARSIASRLSMPFFLLGLDQFKGTDFLNVEQNIDISSDDAHELINQSSISNFNELSYYDPQLKYFSSSYDDRVLKISGVTQLDGLFQSEKYFYGDLTKLGNYFNVQKSILERNKVPSDLGVINLRGGEYKRHKSLILPASYWDKAIRNLQNRTGVKSFLVVTDDVAYARSLFPKYEILQGGIGDCYATLCNAQHLILSNSSFSYFPVKTGGNAKVVIAPRYWSRFANEHKRWASIANCYQDWLWQDVDGNLSSYEECLPEVENTIRFYESTYSIRTIKSEVLKKPIRSYVPQKIRSLTKRYLGLIFPTRIG